MSALRAADFEPGVPVDLALKYTTPKNVAGRFGKQAMFTTSRGALYLDREPASDLEMQVRHLAITPDETIRVMRMSKPGGSYGLQRVGDSLGDTLEEQLVKSLAARGLQPPGAESSQTAAVSENAGENNIAAASVTAAQDDSRQHSGNPPPRPRYRPALGN